MNELLPVTTVKPGMMFIGSYNYGLFLVIAITRTASGWFYITRLWSVDASIDAGLYPIDSSVFLADAEIIVV